VAIPDYWLLLAEGHLTRRLFGARVRRMEALPAPAGQRLRVAGENLAKKGGRGGEVSVQSLGDRAVPGLPAVGRSQPRKLTGHRSR